MNRKTAVRRLARHAIKCAKYNPNLAYIVKQIAVDLAAGNSVKHAFKKVAEGDTGTGYVPRLDDYIKYLPDAANEPGDLVRLLVALNPGPETRGIIKDAITLRRAIKEYKDNGQPIPPEMSRTMADLNHKMFSAHINDLNAFRDKTSNKPIHGTPASTNTPTPKNTTNTTPTNTPTPKNTTSTTPTNTPTPKNTTSTTPTNTPTPTTTQPPQQKGVFDTLKDNADTIGAAGLGGVAGALGGHLLSDSEDEEKRKRNMLLGSLLGAGATGVGYHFLNKNQATA
jgi:hypothetical protein